MAIYLAARFKLYPASALVALATLFALAEPARADLQICSRMSYVVETAIAVEDKGAAATRGWFRINPGQCRTVLQGAMPGETLYLHARALPVYGGSPLPQAGHANFCVGADTFVLPASQSCNRSGQRIARFTAVKPTETEKGLTTYLAEDAEYTALVRSPHFAPGAAPVCSIISNASSRPAMMRLRTRSRSFASIGPASSRSSSAVRGAIRWFVMISGSGPRNSVVWARKRSTQAWSSAENACFARSVIVRAPCP